MLTHKESIWISIYSWSHTKYVATFMKKKVIRHMTKEIFELSLLTIIILYHVVLAFHSVELKLIIIFIINTTYTSMNTMLTIATILTIN